MTASVKKKGESHKINYNPVDQQQIDNPKFPKIALVIIIAEFCERFSYSGMRAFLTLYLKSKLMYTDDQATEIYHAFSTLVFFFPILGALVSDNYLGKYRTILYMMFVYACGNILVALTAIPPLCFPARLCTMIGLFLITIGTGGIKPCAAAFGGEQFNGSQHKFLSLYFMIMYFSMCLAASFAKSISPILRSEIQCFGDKDCYSVAFGLPGIIMLSSIVIFAGAKRFYCIREPTGTVLLDVGKCITYGIRNRCSRNANRRKISHWLDSTSDRFDAQLITDIKKTLLLLMLYIPLPAYWALSDQMGSRWTLQASRMNGDFGFLTIKPDQTQVLAPIFIIILIPLFQKVIYPSLNSFRLLTNPLHKITLGAVIASAAFICSAFLELHLEKTYPELPSKGEAQLRIFNYNDVSGYLTLKTEMETAILPQTVYCRKHLLVNGSQNIVFHQKLCSLNHSCYNLRNNLEMKDNAANSFFVDGANILNYFDTVTKTRSGLPAVRFLISEQVNVTSFVLWNMKRKTDEFTEKLHVGVNHLLELMPETFSLYVGGRKIQDNISFKMGGVYTIVIDNINGDFSAHIHVITEPNQISMILLLPQYLLLSISEVLFAVTGLEFSYNEAPKSMKAVVQAAWLLTEAFGNIMIIIITRFAVDCDQATQSFIYSGILIAAIIIFMLIGRKYQKQVLILNSECSSKINNECLTHSVMMEVD